MYVWILFSFGDLCVILNTSNFILFFAKRRRDVRHSLLCCTLSIANVMSVSFLTFLKLTQYKIHQIWVISRVLNIVEGAGYHMHIFCLLYGSLINYRGCSDICQTIVHFSLIWSCAVLIAGIPQVYDRVINQMNSFTNHTGINPHDIGFKYWDCSNSNKLHVFKVKSIENMSSTDVLECTDQLYEKTTSESFIKHQPLGTHKSHNSSRFEEVFFMWSSFSNDEGWRFYTLGLRIFELILFFLLLCSLAYVSRRSLENGDKVKERGIAIILMSLITFLCWIPIWLVGEYIFINSSNYL